MQSLMKRIHKYIYNERLHQLISAIIPEVHAGDRILDVGCGMGILLDTLRNDPRCPKNISVHGLERVPRGGEPIPVTGYSGGRIPFEDGAFDLVVIADVLHHEPDEMTLLAECARVACRAVILKDHAREGLFAQLRISLIDWAANAPYGVPCLYRYHSVEEWNTLIKNLNLNIVRQLHPMKLYPKGWEFAFGGQLQYFAVLKK